MDLDLPTNFLSCGLCSPKKIGEGDSVDCKSCHNIMLYHEKKEKSVEERNNNILQRLQTDFPGPCEIVSNDIYGNYVVASRRIEEGELICYQKPLYVGPYGPSELIPYCLGCYKDVSLSCKCSKCKWPVCDSHCENAAIHAENECKVFCENSVRSKGLAREYFAIEVLRCLLSRKKSPEKWEKILHLETHTEARREEWQSVELLKYITHFIEDQCKMVEFDSETMDMVVGILCINTFWAHKYTERFASLLFDHVSLFAHDCDPNTRREIIQLPGEVREPVSFAIQIHARRAIEKGETISIHYVDCEKKVDERRSILKDLFYFDCCCGRCLSELMELTQINANGEGSDTDTDSDGAASD